MQRAMAIIGLCLLTAGCASDQATPGTAASGNIKFLAAPPPGGARVGWASFNDHLSRHYADDAMAHLRQEAAGKGANAVVLLGVDPPDSMGRFGQFEVYGYLATVYVWADLYYCPGLTNAPARETPGDKGQLVQLVSPGCVPTLSTLFAAGSTR